MYKYSIKYEDVTMSGIGNTIKKSREAAMKIVFTLYSPLQASIAVAKGIHTLKYQGSALGIIGKFA